MEKHCITLRRIAKGDRTLFYYNGHGVPKPTSSGELWVFNKDYSQYIPISIIQLQTWLGSPTIYVWDCSSAGNLLQNFINYAEKRDREMNEKHGGYPNGMRPFMECIQMAACLPDEQLPMCPELPADLFTSCLTSPIDMALRYFVMSHQLPTPVTVAMIPKIPGDLKDRRTPLGELNWILTSITDTIAWTTFPRAMFQKLFRSDLMVAALFRNFLLAERIMKNYHCTPHTYPPLPPTNTHPMWASWDMAIDNCLKQIPAMIAAEEAVKDGAEGAISIYEYRSSDFFIHHLKAFSIWVTGHGTGRPGRPLTIPDNTENLQQSLSMLIPRNYNIKAYLAPRQSPDELPIILQLLLSNTYRVQALFLICQFMDLGPWAVHLALLIGVFPYVQRLLQAPNQDLRAPLIFIWTRIIAVDDSRRNELFVFGGWTYFAQVLSLDQRETQNTTQSALLPNPTEHRAMCLFVIAEVCRNNHTAQNAIVFPQSATHNTPSVFSSAYDALDDPDYLLRQWAALCLAQMWCKNDEVKAWALDVAMQDKLVTMLGDDKSPEVRAACLYAIGTLMGAPSSPDQKGGGGLGGMAKYDEFTLLRFINCPHLG
jgi:regulator-associated protein of mTOR